MIHGNRDETNPIRHDRRAFVPLADAGATIRFSEIDHLDHEVPPVVALPTARWPTSCCGGSA